MSLLKVSFKVRILEISKLYLKTGQINAHLINPIRYSLSDTKSAFGVLSALLHVPYKVQKARGAYMDCGTSGPTFSVC